MSTGMSGLSLVSTALFNSPLDSLYEVAHEILHDKIPLEYVSTLSDRDKADALRACLLVYILSSSTIVPRTFQLQASLATLNGKDAIITAGTGSGKTLCLLIPILLRPGTISLTISPLKRLQTTQSEFWFVWVKDLDQEVEQRDSSNPKDLQSSLNAFR